jgi:hypothetical protein
MRRFQILEPSICEQGWSWQSTSFFKALIAWLKGEKVRTLKHNIPQLHKIKCKHEWKESVGIWADHDERCTKCGLKRSWNMDPDCPGEWYYHGCEYAKRNTEI